MTIPVQQFQILSPEQANPLSSGMSRAMEIYKNFIVNKYLPQQFQQQGEAQDLANSLSKIKLQYAPDVEKSNIASQLAQTGLTNQENQFYPLKMLMEAKRIQQSGSRFGAAYQLMRILQGMPPAAKALWVSQNQGAYNQMLSDLGNKNDDDTFNLDISKELSKYFPNVKNASDITNKQTFPDKNEHYDTKKIRFNNSSPEQISQIQNASNLEANKSLTTAATRRQLEGAIQVENIMNDPVFKSQAQNASMYAGALGKGKASLDSLSQTNPKAYEDYIAFKNQTLVLLENRIKTLDQMGATDSQRKDLKNLFDKTADSLTSNPKQFMIQLNKLTDTLGIVARSVQKSASPATFVNRLSSTNFNNENNKKNVKTINGIIYYRIGNSDQWQH